MFYCKPVWLICQKHLIKNSYSCLESTFYSMEVYGSASPKITKITQVCQPKKKNKSAHSFQPNKPSDDPSPTKNGRAVHLPNPFLPNLFPVILISHSLTASTLPYLTLPYTWNQFCFSFTGCPAVCPAIRFGSCSISTATVNVTSRTGRRRRKKKKQLWVGCAAGHRRRVPLV